MAKVENLIFESSAFSTMTVAVALDTANLAFESLLRDWWMAMVMVDGGGGFVAVVVVALPYWKKFFLSVQSLRWN